jgi:hypothetical protein
VLIVHGPNPDGAGMAPRNSCHLRLHEQLEYLSAAGWEILLKL